MNNSTIKAALFLLLISGSIFGLSKVYDLDRKILKVDSIESITGVNRLPGETKTPSSPKTPDSTKLHFPIFMYHHLDYFNDSTPHERIVTYIAITSKKLREQLDYIQKLGYETITFADIEAGNIPSKPIMLTFDDSYDDLYTKAYPELKKRHMKAISYVVTGKLDTKGYLTTEQVKELDLNGMEIAAHTITHPDLTKLKDDELKKEINDSKTFLEKLLNKPVLSFAYPFGKYSLRIRKIVEDAGYKYAVTVNPGLTNFKEPLDLQRDRVYSDTDIGNYIH